MGQYEQLARNPVHDHDPDNEQSPSLLFAVFHRAGLCGHDQCHPYEDPHQYYIVPLHPVPEKIARLPNHEVEREHHIVVVGSTP
jgi:hypothetical protein